MSTKKPIDQGIIARVSGAIQAAKDAWFGPLQPLVPLVPEPLVPSVTGRQFDYPVGINKNTQPRSNEAISFPQLRGLADACDVLRIVIETRKDQMSKLKWKIVPKDDSKDPDSRCQELEDFFAFPDREHDWDTWLRMLMEDLFVIDAPTLYLRKTNGKKIYSLEPMDGATIKRVITDQGRTPMPSEGAAYQQILKGIAAIDYTTDELIYKPRNVRTCKIYGFSPVEQIIMTVNIALRRSVHKLQYYTEGNIPEAIVGTPTDWNPDQISLFQKHWDALNEGNTAERRHMKFVPGKVDAIFTKEEVMKDMFDEWLARIVCFAFSIEPTAFIHQQNRATADSAREAALAEGLAPIQQWVVNLINYIIWNVFGYKDLKFDWADEEVQDPLQRAQVNQIYVQEKVITPNEVREDLGLPDLTPAQLEEMAAATPPPPMISPPEPGTGLPSTKPQTGVPSTKPKTGVPSVKPTAGIAKALNKAKKVVPAPIDGERASIKKLQGKMKKVIANFLQEQGKAIAQQIRDNVSKADTPKGKAKSILKGVDYDWSGLVPDTSVILGAVAMDGAMAGLKSVGSALSPEDGPATAWAQDRAAEMIGKKWVDGELVDNPDAVWVITDSTREMVQLFVSDSIDQGLTTSELADALVESFAFSEERANMIARTETANADSAGQMQGYVESGVVEGTEWTTAEDDDVDDVCTENADAGFVPLGELYPSGDAAPPAHPNCRCAIVAVLYAQGEAEGDLPE